MTWWDAVPVLLAAIVVVLGPGGAVLAALGVRGLPLLALAPAASVAVLGGGAVLLGFVSVPWQPWIALLATALAAGIAVLLRRWLGAPRSLRTPSPAGSGWIFAGGAVVAALVGALPLVAGMRRVDRVPQTWDTVFHLNAIRYIEDTGRASSLLLNGLVDHRTNSGFYPAGWHVSAATVAEPLGADPMVVTNVMVLVLAGLVVPAGTALATRALIPDWRWSAGVGAVLGAVFAAMPAMMVSWGTLYPNAWATAMLPAVLGAALLCLRGPDRASWLAVVIGAAGATLAHPTFVFAFALLGAPLAAQALARRWQGLGTASWRLWAEVAALVVLVGAALLVMTQSALLDSIRAFRWAPTETMPQAVGEAIVDSPLSELGHGVNNASWLLGAVLVLGVIRAAANSDQWPWVVSLAFAVGAFAISAGALSDSILRDYVTGFWYNDPVRLAALVPVAAAPLVAVGFRTIADWLAGGVPARLQNAPGAARVLEVALVPVLVLAFLVATGGYAQKREDRLAFWYWPTPGLPERQLVTPAEQDLLRRMDDLIPPGARLLADPFGGGALAYALGNREVVFPHLTGDWSDVALRTLRLMPDVSDPGTCRALQELEADYLYVDPELYVGSNPIQTKFEDLDRAPSSGVRLIERADTAALYEITACG